MNEIKSDLVIEELYAPKYERKNCILKGDNAQNVQALLNILTVEEKVL